MAFLTSLLRGRHESKLILEIPHVRVPRMSFSPQRFVGRKVIDRQNYGTKLGVSFLDSALAEFGARADFACLGIRKTPRTIESIG